MAHYAWNYHFEDSQAEGGDLVAHLEGAWCLIPAPSFPNQHPSREWHGPELPVAGTSSVFFSLFSELIIFTQQNTPFFLLA